MPHLSPLRYPGGKARLASFLTDAIDLNELRGCSYYEPYAGGAGAALALLKTGVVTNLYLNDADRRVFAFWRSVLDESDRFAEKILTVKVTIKEWRRQRAICANPESHCRFDIGFAAFFMNRCNRSGVLTGAGPIGGYEQEGKWRLGVRFNRSGLAGRILELKRLRESIHVSRQDAIDFLKGKLPRGLDRKRVLVYLDPPYVSNGQRLYLNAYGPGDHAQLARYVQAQGNLPWIMSYDDNPLVRGMYSSCKVALLPINYSLQVKRSAHELIIAPKYLAVPAACRAIPVAELLRKAS
jgi:DNA adenine methylase